MGAITGLLLAPFLAPVWGFRFVLERLRDEAEAVLRDEGRAFAELIDLSMRHSTGQLTDAQYTEQEAVLLERLSTIREYRHDLMHNGSIEDDEEWSVDLEHNDGEEEEDESSYAEAEQGEVNR